MLLFLLKMYIWGMKKMYSILLLSTLALTCAGNYEGYHPPEGTVLKGSKIEPNVGPVNVPTAIQIVGQESYALTVAECEVQKSYCVTTNPEPTGQSVCLSAGYGPVVSADRSVCIKNYNMHQIPSLNFHYVEGRATEYHWC